MSLSNNVKAIIFASLSCTLFLAVEIAIATYPASFFNGASLLSLSSIIAFAFNSLILLAVMFYNSLNDDTGFLTGFKNRFGIVFIILAFLFVYAFFSQSFLASILFSIGLMSFIGSILFVTFGFEAVYNFFLNKLNKIQAV